MAFEAAANEGKAWEIQQPISESKHETLRDQNGGVAAAQTEHEDTQCFNSGAGEEHGAEVAKVKEWTRDDANDDKEKRAQGANPGDGGGGDVREVGERVVGLEGSEGEGEAP